MLNHQLIRVDNAGRLRTTYDDPIMFNGGTPTKYGYLCIDELEPATVYLSGLGYVVSRKICVKQGEEEPEPKDADRLWVAPYAGNSPAPKYWRQGLPFDQKGALCIAKPEPVVIPLGDSETPTSDSF